MGRFARGPALRLVLVGLATLAVVACDGAPASLDPRDATPPPAPDARAPAPDVLLERLLHVSPGADPVSADGSRERPYPDLVGAYVVAQPGDTVFLLPGDFGAAIEPPPQVALYGSGAELSTLDGPLVLTRPGADVRALAVLGGEPAVTIEAPAGLLDVTVRDAIETGVLVRADATFEGLWVLGPLRRPGADPPGYGEDGPSPGAAVAVETGASLTWRGGGIQGADWVGLRAGAATVQLDELEILGTGGPGVLIEGGALVVRRLRVDAATGAGVRVIEGTAELTDVDVTDVIYAADQGTGTGVGFVRARGQVTGLRVTGGERGLRIGEGAVVDATDVQVGDGSGSGVGVNGGTVRVRDLRVERMHNGGATVSQDGTLMLDGATFTATDRFGVLASGATLDARHVHVIDAPQRGVALLRAVAVITDLQIERAGEVGLAVTDPPADGAVQIGPAVITDCRGAGLSVFGRGGAPVLVTDLTVTGTLPGDGDLADGIQLFDAQARLVRVRSAGSGGAGASLEHADAVFEGVTLEDNAGPGVLIVDPAGPLLATDLVAQRNGGHNLLVLGGLVELRGGRLAEARAEPREGPGHGGLAAQGATLVLRGVEVRGNAGHGLVALNRSTLRLEAVTVTGNGGNGVNVACDGSTLSEPAANTFADNAAGDRGGCP